MIIKTSKKIFKNIIKRQFDGIIKYMLMMKRVNNDVKRRENEEKNNV